MQRLFFSSKSKLFSPFHLNHLVQSFIMLLFWTFCPLVLPLLCSLFVPFSQNFALIDPRRGNPLLASAAHARYSLFWYSSVFTNPPVLLQHTEIHILALTPMSSPGPMRDYTFIGFFSLFSSGEQGQASWNLTSTLAADERSGLSLHIFSDLWYYHVIIHKD